MMVQKKPEFHDKPFACSAQGCDMTFTNKDHLEWHHKKHEMMLNLGLVNKNNEVADQTPTPTRFIRNCEEVGLFQDLNVNPFDEIFKKAADMARNGVTIDIQSNNSDDTLHTPHILPHVIENRLAVPEFSRKNDSDCESFGFPTNDSDSDELIIVEEEDANIKETIKENILKKNTPSIRVVPFQDLIDDSTNKKNNSKENKSKSGNKIEQVREMNRAAQLRCRKRKQAAWKVMEQELTTLREENLRLKKELETLRLEHSKCPPNLNKDIATDPSQTATPTKLSQRPVLVKVRSSKHIPILPKPAASALGAGNTTVSDLKRLKITRASVPILPKPSASSLGAGITTNTTISDLKTQKGTQASGSVLPKPSASSLGAGITTIGDFNTHNTTISDIQTQITPTAVPLLPKPTASSLGAGITTISDFRTQNSTFSDFRTENTTISGTQTQKITPAAVPILPKPSASSLGAGITTISDFRTQNSTISDFRTENTTISDTQTQKITPAAVPVLPKPSASSLGAGITTISDFRTQNSTISDLRTENTTISERQTQKITPAAVPILPKPSASSLGAGITTIGDFKTQNTTSSDLKTQKRTRSSVSVLPKSSLGVGITTISDFRTQNSTISDFGTENSTISDFMPQNTTISDLKTQKRTRTSLSVLPKPSALSLEAGINTISDCKTQNATISDFKTQNATISDFKTHNTATSDFDFKTQNTTISDFDFKTQNTTIDDYDFKTQNINISDFDFKTENTIISDLEAQKITQASVSVLPKLSPLPVGAGITTFSDFMKQNTTISDFKTHDTTISDLKTQKKNQAFVSVLPKLTPLPVGAAITTFSDFMKQNATISDFKTQNTISDFKTKLSASSLNADIDERTQVFGKIVKKRPNIIRKRPNIIRKRPNIIRKS